MMSVEGLMPDVLERPSAPTRHRLDVAAYYKMAETGILENPKHLELIDGQIMERFPVPIRHRLDVDAYYKMAEIGILTRTDRVELVDGEIIDMPPIGSPHAGVVKRLTQQFARAVADGLVILSVQDPLRLTSYDEPEPDLMLLRPRRDSYTESHPTAADVLLLVEVADSSLAFDRGVKLPLYAKFGIPDVWIVDIAGAVIEVYREPKESEYSVRERHCSGMLSPSLVPGVAIDVAVLFA
jgi:Uma2 family endonuclease